MAVPKCALLVALSCWQPAAIAPACPEGFFRSSAIVWNCSGSTGSSFFFLQPNLQVGVAIPEGVTNFWANAYANFDVDLELFDPVAKTNALKYETLHSSRRHKSVMYLGTTIEYSADETKQIPFHESIWIKGTMFRTMFLRFHDEYDKHFITKLTFGYSGIKTCPATPHGCSTYDQALAGQVVRQWSRWAQSHYMTAQEAWHALARVKLDGAVHWFMWNSVWRRNEDTSSWQLAFHFLDSNKDAQITVDEFEQGFHLHSWTKAEILASITAWRAWLCANYGYDRELSWKAFKSAAGPIPRTIWQSEVWADWFRSWGRSLKVSAEDAFDSLDTDLNGEISRSEFMEDYSSDICVQTKPTAGTKDGRGNGTGTAPVASEEASDDRGGVWHWLSLLGIHPGGNLLTMCMLPLCCCICCGLPLGIFLHSRGLFKEFKNSRAARVVRSRGCGSSDVVSAFSSPSQELKQRDVGCATPHPSSSVPMPVVQSGSPMGPATIRASNHGHGWWQRWWPVAPSPTIQYTPIACAEEVTATGQPAVYKTTSLFAVNECHAVSEPVAEATTARGFHTLLPFNGQSSLLPTDSHSTLLPSSSVSSISQPASFSTLPPVVYSRTNPSTTFATLASRAIDGALLQHHQASSVSPRRSLSPKHSPRHSDLPQRPLSPPTSASSIASAPMLMPRHVGSSLQFAASPRSRTSFIPAR